MVEGPILIDPRLIVTHHPTGDAAATSKNNDDLVGTDHRLEPNFDHF